MSYFYLFDNYSPALLQLGLPTGQTWQSHGNCVAREAYSMGYLNPSTSFLGFHSESQGGNRSSSLLIISLGFLFPLYWFCVLFFLLVCRQLKRDYPFTEAMIQNLVYSLTLGELSKPMRAIHFLRWITVIPSTQVGWKIRENLICESYLSACLYVYLWAQIN